MVAWMRACIVTSEATDGASLADLMPVGWNGLPVRTNAGARATPLTSRGRTLAERLDGLLLAVIDIENSHQFGHLQQVSDALRQVGQFDGAAAIARGSIQRDQRPQPAAVDVSDSRQVEDDALALCDHHFYGVAQIGGFFAKNNTATAIDDHNVIYGSDNQFQLHGSPLGQQPTQKTTLWSAFFATTRWRGACPDAN